MKRAAILGLVAALLMAGTALAASFATGTYQGKTSQQGPIKIVVASKSSMKSVDYKAGYGCFDSHNREVGTTVQPTHLPSAPIKNGHVDKTYKLLGGTDQIHFVATFSGNKATGYFKEAYVSTSNHVCVSGKVTFSIKH